MRPVTPNKKALANCIAGAFLNYKRCEMQMKLPSVSLNQAAFIPSMVATPFVVFMPGTS
jgi:hypothetical protein